MHPLLVVLAVAALGVALVFRLRYVALRREAHVRHFELPKGLFEKLRARHPQLSLKDCQLVANGLRQFFLAHLKSGRKFVAMPSQVVDDLWHEFILCTKSYDSFCRQGFGRFLHHTPAVVLTDDRLKNEGLRRCWWFACREENIDPRAPSRLPLLFALDAKLNIADGFSYVPDCGGVRRAGADNSGSTPHCGSDFCSDGVDGSTDGFGDGGSDGGGDGGGCGGGGD